MKIITICPMCKEEICLSKEPNIWNLNIFEPRYVGDYCETCARRIFVTACVTADILKSIKNEKIEEEKKKR